MSVTTIHDAVVSDGDGATVDFDITYTFDTASDIRVALLDLETGLETEQANPADFTITGSAAAGWKVTFGTAPTQVNGGETAGQKVVHWRDTPGKQAQSLQDLLKFPALPISNMGDYLARSVQAVDVLAKRSLRVPLTETTGLTVPNIATRKGTALAFDATTGDIELIATTDLAALASRTDAIDALSTAGRLAAIDAIKADFDGDDTIGDAAALLAVAAPGFVAKDTGGTPVARALTVGSGLTISNGDGGAGDPLIEYNTTSDAHLDAQDFGAIGKALSKRAAPAASSYLIAQPDGSVVEQATVGAGLGDLVAVNELSEFDTTAKRRRARINIGVGEAWSLDRFCSGVDGEDQLAGLNEALALQVPLIGTPGKTYYYEGQLIGGSFVDIDLQGATLKPAYAAATGDAAKYAFYGNQLTLGTVYTVTVQAAGARSVTLSADPTDIAVGDRIIFLADSYSGRWPPSYRTVTAKPGGNVLDLDAPIPFAYGGTVTCRTISMGARFVLRNGVLDCELIIDGTAEAIGVLYNAGYGIAAASDLALTNVDLNQSNTDYLLNRDYCLDVLTQRVRAPNAIRNGGFETCARARRYLALDNYFSGDGFGVAPFYCDYFNVARNIIHGRYGVGGTHSIRGIRPIGCLAGEISENDILAYDSGIKIEDCADLTVSQNEIKHTYTGLAQSDQSPGTRSGGHRFIGNDIVEFAGNGIAVGSNATGDGVFRPILIDGNHIETSDATASQPILQLGGTVIYGPTNEITDWPSGQYAFYADSGDGNLPKGHLHGLRAVAGTTTGRLGLYINSSATDFEVDTRGVICNIATVYGAFPSYAVREDKRPFWVPSFSVGGVPLSGELLTVRGGTSASLGVRADTGGGQAFYRVIGGTRVETGSSNNIHFDVFVNNSQRARFDTSGNLNVVAGAIQIGAVATIDSARDHLVRAATLAAKPAAATAGKVVQASDLGGGAGLLEDNGSAWKRVGDRGIATVASDADFTLTPLTDAPQIHHTGTLTADRTITLSTTNAVNGSAFRVARNGGGAFNLSVGGLKTLATNQWCEVVYDGSAWRTMAFGSL